MSTTRRPIPGTAGRRGSVQRDPRSGLWGFVVDATPPGSTVRKQVRRRGFTSQREARAALTSVLADLHTGSYVQPDLTTTLAQYVHDTWLPVQRVKQLRPATLESYQRNLEVHVLPRLGRRPLSQVTTAELDRLYADLSLRGGPKGPLAPRTVRYIHTIMLGVYGHAVGKEHVALNPVSRAHAPSPRACRGREMSTWTSAQLGVFLRSLHGDAFRAPLFVLATTGMRRGEALGLQWRDVRLDQGQLDVRRTLSSVASKLVVGAPKTDRGRRTVSLDPPTVAVLRKHRLSQRHERLSLGLRVSDQDWVYAQPDGAPLHPTRFTPVFHRRVAAAHLPAIRLHDLCHTWATLALRAGVNPKIVQERIGHASVAITLDLYTHLDQAQHDQAARDVTALFWNDDEASTA